MFFKPFFLLPATASTITGAALERRQSGGDFVAVGNLYGSGGCTDLIFADPIFGEGNVCQPLDRNGNVPDIESYSTVSVNEGCFVNLFTDLACTQGETSAPVGTCVQASAPFVAAFVRCT